MRLMPRAQDRTEEQEVDQMVSRLNCPDLEPMTSEQLVGEAGGRDKSEPEHKGSRCA